VLPDARFTDAPDPFWAVVRSVGDHLGYTVRGAGLTRHTADAIGAYLTGAGLVVPDTIIEAVATYIAVRADLLEHVVGPALMNKAEAAAEYELLLASGLWQSYQPMYGSSSRAMRVSARCTACIASRCSQGP
jgi:hypothetical protein